MSALVNEHVAIDLISVSEKLRTLGNLEAVGGPVVLADLSQNIGAAAHIEYYLKILKQKTIQRDLITASYEILRESFDETVIVDNLIDDAQTKVFQAIQTNDKHDVKTTCRNCRRSPVLPASPAAIPPSTGSPRAGRSRTSSSWRPVRPWVRRPSP